MPNTYDITLAISCQSFKSTSYESFETKDVLHVVGTRSSEEFICPFCGRRMHVNGTETRTLKDLSPHVGKVMLHEVEVRRFQCPVCGHCESETIPYRYPSSVITDRLASWIKEILRHMTVSSVSRLTGVHHALVKAIHKDEITECLKDRLQTAPSCRR